MMTDKKKLPCELIDDILPSYVEGLTNEVTNGLVKEHFNECESCMKKYNSMKNPMAEEDDKDRVNDIQEIDFLKKTKKKNRTKIIACAAVIFVLAVIFVEAKYFIIGNNMSSDYLSYMLEVKDKQLNIVGETTSNSGVKAVEITENDGVVEISISGVQKSLFYGSDFEKKFTATNDIKQVWIGDTIIWAEGEKISPLTSRLNSKHNLYIGDLSADGEIIRAMNMTAYTGNFKNELQTKEEPYAWNIIFEDDFSSRKEAELDSRLKCYGYILLAEIENLGEVDFHYTIDGEEVVMTITASEASSYAGEDIKIVGKDIVKLEKLVRKTALDQYVLSSNQEDTNN